MAAKIFYATPRQRDPLAPFLGQNKAGFMPDTPSRLPFGLNRTRLFLLALGVALVLITVSMALGGLNSYQALKDAANAAKEPSAEQLQAN